MGAFFESIHVKTENSDAVRSALDRVAKEADCKFLLGPSLNGWISVFPSEGWFPNDAGEHEQIAGRLARLVPDDIFQLIVHDDDIFYYYIYREGKLIDRYNSHPDYFEEVSEEEKQECRGRPELFQNLLRDPKSISQLKTLLAAEHAEYIFENERLAQFADLLGLSNASSSYEYLQEGERDEIEGWEQFIHIEHQPISAKDYNNRGQAKRVRHDLDGALADFDKAIELNPALVEARANRDRVVREKGELNLTHAENYNKFGEIKRSDGDLDGAMHGYNKAIEFNPGLAEAYNNRGFVKCKKGDLDGAIIDFNKAIELKPDLAASYSNRADVKKAKSDFEGALADFDRAIELKSDSSQLYNNRGELKRARGDYDGALADYNKAIELKPDSSAAYNNRGELKRGKGDLDGALADYNHAIEIKPDSAPAYNNRGLAKRLKGDLDGALADYSKAIELKPGLAQFYSNRGDVKRVKGNLDEALIDYNKAIELKPDWADAYNNRGEAKRAKGELDGALVDYNRAIELNPGLAPAYNNRGLVKRAKGNLDSALVDFGRAAELQPKSAQIYSNRGLVRRAKGDLDGALADYEKALELNPNLAAARTNRDEAKRAKDKLAVASAPRAGGSGKKIPAMENTLALRTDFSDEPAWKALCEAIQNPEDDFAANVDFVSDTAYDGVTASQLPSMLSEDSALSFAFVIDQLALSHPDHPILVVDLQEEPGRTFRVVLSEIGVVENNLSIANMGFDEFAGAVDEEGIFRGF